MGEEKNLFTPEIERRLDAAEASMDRGEGIEVTLDDLANNTRHRCRLYHLNETVEDIYVEVWDTLQRPYEYSGDVMPDGELIVSCEDASRRRVRALMDAAEAERGIYFVGDHAGRGTI